jgi:hypothetical protein
MQNKEKMVTAARELCHQMGSKESIISWLTLRFPPTENDILEGHPTADIAHKYKTICLERVEMVDFVFLSMRLDPEYARKIRYFMPEPDLMTVLARLYNHFSWGTLREHPDPTLFLSVHDKWQITYMPIQNFVSLFLQAKVDLLIPLIEIIVSYCRFSNTIFDFFLYQCNSKERLALMEEMRKEGESIFFEDLCLLPLSNYGCNVDL